MNSTTTDTNLPHQKLVAGGLSIGWAIGQLANRHTESHQAISFSALMKALLTLRDKHLLSDDQFSELVETACTAIIEKQVSHAIEKVMEHQINVNLLTKLLSK